MKKIRYEAKIQAATGGTFNISVTVSAPDINIGFAYAAIKTVAELQAGDEVVSLTFWTVQD